MEKRSQCTISNLASPFSHISLSFKRVSTTYTFVEIGTTRLNYQTPTTPRAPRRVGGRLTSKSRAAVARTYTRERGGGEGGDRCNCEDTHTAARVIPKRRGLTKLGEIMTLDNSSSSCPTCLQHSLRTRSDPASSPSLSATTEVEANISAPSAS